MSPKPATIDAYIATFPQETQAALQAIRALIHRTAPGTGEGISYNMAAFYQQGKHLVYLAAFKQHIGLYSVPTGEAAFEKAFSKYKTGKGSIQFPLSEPMPLKLIEKILRYKLKGLNTKAMPQR